MVDYNFKNYKRISKVAARKLFADGKEIRIAPCKVNIEILEKLNNPFNFYFDISNKNEGTFDTLVNMCTAYNCNFQLGYYLAYYIKK